MIDDNGRTWIPEIDLEIEDRVRERYSTVADDFSSARGEVETVRTRIFSRNWSERIERDLL